MITLQEFEALVPDKGIRDYITCGIDEDNLLSEVLNYVPIYQNIINLAFMYAFSCYLDLKNNTVDGKRTNLESYKKKSNANSQRVIRTMQHIYSRYPLSSELMQFVLSDIYYDFIQGENACLKPFFPDCVSAGDYWCDKGIGLNDYFAFINEHAESSRVDKDPLGRPFNLETAAQHLRLLIGFFPFLGRTALRFDEKSGWYVFVIKNYMGKLYRGGIIDTYDLIKKFGTRDRYFCFLSTIERDALRYETPRLNKFIVCPMAGVAGDGSFTKDGESIKQPFCIPTDYETVMSYFSATESSGSGKKNALGTSMEQLFNINYKYMKNLALAIADIIGKKHNQQVGLRLKEVFESRYTHAFENYTEESKNWDSIIIILLIEAGPTTVLREILYVLDDVGDEELLRNVRRRFGGMLTGVLAKVENGDDLTEKAIELLGARYIKNAASEDLDKYNRELVAKAKTQLILSAIAKAEENDTIEFKGDCFHTDDIQQYIIMLEASRHDTASNKCELVNRTLGDTLKRLICFYNGIFKYGREKIKFDNATRKKVLSPAEIKQFQTNAEQAFLSEVKRNAKKLKEVESTVELIRIFVNLCDDCCRSEISVAQMQSAESRQLYAVLGKNYIMNKLAFEKIVDINTVSSINEDNVDWWINTSIAILQFFSSGGIGHASSPRFYNAIAPMVASYNNHNDSKDGYDTATFALIFDANEISGKGMEINMLSEFSYEISKRYYCLPNVVRSNNKWWIDPFVIKCTEFDTIFFEG